MLYIYVFGVFIIVFKECNGYSTVWPARKYIIVRKKSADFYRIYMTIVPILYVNKGMAVYSCILELI